MISPSRFTKLNAYTVCNLGLPILSQRNLLYVSPSCHAYQCLLRLIDEGTSSVQCKSCSLLMLTLCCCPGSHLTLCQPLQPIWVDMTWRLTPSNTFWTIAMHFMVGCGVLTDYWVHARAPAIEQLKFCGRPSSPPNREVWHTIHSIICMQCKEIYKPKMCPVSEVSGMNSMLRHMYRVKKICNYTRWKFES